jgi:hypothetical protein
MKVIRLSVLAALLGWAMLPFAYPPNGEPVDGDRVVGGFCGTCDATVACPRCLAVGGACSLSVGFTTKCVCPSGSTDGCMGINPNHPECVTSVNPFASCNPSICGGEDRANCTLAFGGCPTPCFCTGRLAVTCTHKC